MTESTQLEDSDSVSTDEDEISAATIVLNPNQETSMDVDSVFETYDSNTDGKIIEYSGKNWEELVKTTINVGSRASFKITKEKFVVSS